MFSVLPFSVFTTDEDPCDCKHFLKTYLCYGELAQQLQLDNVAITMNLYLTSCMLSYARHVQHPTNKPGKLSSIT